MNKVQLFLAGRWTAEEPNVSTMFWSVETWVNWIDVWGEWQV